MLANRLNSSGDLGRPYIVARREIPEHRAPPRTTRIPRGTLTRDTSSWSIWRSTPLMSFGRTETLTSKYHVTLVDLKLLGLPWCLRAECPEVMSLVMNVEECVGVLEEHKGKTLRGELNPRNKVQACQDYRDSIKCLDDIIASCQGRREQHSKETAMQFKKDQKGGFGQLCENQTYFGGKSILYTPDTISH
ncbi:hypothetical protein LSH36_734g00009 [Paralvinella palmiformis]|uniref:Uncharacterized protein n=1 Tax=Paralvinella palmiformis TaxID=53620 RepID=A0AAD9J251_9ANNE|nr:hypothetical protein LSH36_734g00009 [Paralvinella palmiformis]